MQLRASGGTASVTRVAIATGISRRQLERRFREQVGLPPRTFARIVRFQRAFHALGRESGAAIAARCGYADQAHLVREVRRFGGQTPSDARRRRRADRPSSGTDPPDRPDLPDLT